MDLSTWTAPGSAVILDTETTDLEGRVIEIAVIDAATGDVLLNTLVHPAGAPISDEARAVHHISEDMVATAPQWAEVVPQLTSAIGTRTILAYNAPFDRAAIGHTCNAEGIDPGELTNPQRWGCIMAARTAALGQRKRLGAGHRALGDCIAARDVLHGLSTTAA